MGKRSTILMQVQLEWKLATKTSGHRRAIIGGGVDEPVYTLNGFYSPRLLTWGFSDGDGS